MLSEMKSKKVVLSYFCPFLRNMDISVIYFRYGCVCFDDKYWTSLSDACLNIPVESLWFQFSLCFFKMILRSYMYIWFFVLRRYCLTLKRSSTLLLNADSILNTDVEFILSVFFKYLNTLVAFVVLLFEVGFPHR